MADVPLDAMDAARAAIAPWSHWLGVQGLPFAQLAELAVRAAAPAIAAAAATSARNELAPTTALLVKRIVALTDERDAAVAAAAPLEAQVSALRVLLRDSQRETRAAVVDAGLLRGSLVAIHSAPYIGDEPPARRVAREALRR